MSRVRAAAPLLAPPPPRAGNHAPRPRAEYNFDDPQAFDTATILECLSTLKRVQPYDVPIYDFATHQRSSQTRRVVPADVVIIEGILVLHMEEIRGLLNMKIFVDTDDDVRLARR